MPLYIEMPKLADTMTEGTLVKWRKKVGDKVATGDVVAEVETEKKERNVLGLFRQMCKVVIL